MSQVEFRKILNKHQRWLNGHPGGVRADFSNLCLSGLNLFGANLRGANLSSANLQGANLQGANLQGANLQVANLQGANLQGANLQGTNLFRANLQGANLVGANLKGADIRETNIEGAKFPKFQIPQTKTLYVYKKLGNGEIAHLRIPRTAQRTATPIGNKCRAERAFVLKIVDRSGKEVSGGRSIHHYDFVYKVGETVSVPDYNDDIRVECTSGIHFFMTEQEAKRY